MSHSLCLIQLHKFENPGWVCNQSGFFGLFGDRSFQVRITGFIQLNARKQVIYQTHEQGLIFIYLYGGRGRNRVSCWIEPWHTETSILFLQGVISKQIWIRHSHQFGEVHVTQNSHDHSLFWLSWVGSLHSTQSSQNRQDVSQAEVIMDLLSDKKKWSARCHAHEQRKLVFIYLTTSASKDKFMENSSLINLK